METYHTEPSASSLIQSPSLPLSLCLGQPHVPSIHTHAVSSPAETVNRLTASQLQRSQPGASRCAQHSFQHSTLQQARFGFVHTWGRGNIAATLRLDMFHVRMIEGRWQEDSGELKYSRNKDESWLPHPRAVWARCFSRGLFCGWIALGACITWISSPPVTYDVTTYYSLSCNKFFSPSHPSQTSGSGSFWERERERGRMASQTAAALQKQTLLWFIVGKSHTLRLRWFAECA